VITPCPGQATHRTGAPLSHGGRSFLFFIISRVILCPAFLGSVLGRLPPMTFFLLFRFRRTLSPLSPESPPPNPIGFERMGRAHSDEVSFCASFSQPSLRKSGTEVHGLQTNIFSTRASLFDPFFRGCGGLFRDVPSPSGLAGPRKFA